MHVRTWSLGSLALLTAAALVGPTVAASQSASVGYPLGLGGASVAACIHTDQVPPTIKCPNGLDPSFGYVFKITSATGDLSVSVKDDTGQVVYFKVIYTTTTGNRQLMCASNQACATASKAIWACLSWTYLNANQILVGLDHDYIEPVSGTLTAHSATKPAIAVDPGSVCVNA